MRCPVCGGVLAERLEGCTTCPLGAGCDMLCCENCGYQTVAPHSRTVELLRRLWNRRPHRRQPPIARRA